MRKKEFAVYAVLTLCSFSAMYFFTQKSQEKHIVLMEEVESLSSNESDEVETLTCNCSLIRSNNCAVDNWGTRCASGKNVKCWSYNKNCS